MDTMARSYNFQNLERRAYILTTEQVNTEDALYLFSEINVALTLAGELQSVSVNFTNKLLFLTRSM